MGNASTMFRVTLTYDVNPSKLPSRMIVKLCKNDLKNRIPFTVTRMNEMEALFYGSKLTDELIDVHGLHVPRGFAGMYDSRCVEFPSRFKL